VGIVISGPRELLSGNGIYSFSGEVACDTNSKTVILLQDTGYRDMILEFRFTGSYEVSDLNVGDKSNFQIIMDDVVIYNGRTNTIDGSNQDQAVSIFAPRNSTVQVTQIDLNGAGVCTSVMRGYYLEPPVQQQD